MENEVMFNEEVMEPEYEMVETGEEKSGISTPIAMLIGMGLTLATTAVVKFGKKAYAKWKAGKEMVLVDEHDFVEPTDEQIEQVTRK